MSDSAYILKANKLESINWSSYLQQLPTLQDVFRTIMSVFNIKTNEEMAVRIKVSATTVSNVLSGRQTHMNTDNLQRLAEEFGLPLRDLVICNAVQMMPKQTQDKIVAEARKSPPSRVDSLPIFTDVRAFPKHWQDGAAAGIPATDLLRHFSLSVPRDAKTSIDAQADDFLYLHRGTSMVSTEPGVKCIPDGSLVLIRPQETATTGDIVLVQFVDDPDIVEPAQLYQYVKHTRSGIVWEQYKPINSKFSDRIRDPGKFAERKLESLRIIIGRAIAVVHSPL